ncbi:ATP-binding cassette domain-containing protein [Epidermidibacterium keratini]|uniref:ATP-binding cassette domain-containing protein n=1 Tax=Epidermidibacterium keratini TaxID=1891644 RepID=A0A7L4YMJ2_9ACTN|nr:ABC transporter ATP-binding protein [Epidermidibacterium keratini]QHC00511.1 ATP-binding cassette domain-containing protein [Epidermidibacterium keratini]
MSTQPAIAVTDLRRRYGDAKRGFEAVKGISFEVHPGELFALLGTNGAGKTSALEVAEGLAKPTGGQVRVLGHDPYADRRAVRSRTGIMLQQGGLPDDLTAKETARMWAGTLPAPRPVTEALELVELDHRADVAVKSLSGGERRRLDLALALMSRPEVLFLDEPTTGLDPQSRHTTWRLVGDLVEGGCAVVLTTHYLDEADELADRLAVMKDGLIVAEGTTRDIAQAYPGTITFRVTGELPALPQLSVAPEHERDRITYRTHQLQRDLTELLGWAATHNLTLEGLQGRAASLEEAFLAIAQDDPQTKEYAA